jgi:hypothetical protein
MRRAAALIVLALAGCGGSGDDLPPAVRDFERELERPRGVLHVVTEEIRVVSEPFMPDLASAGWSDELWLDLGGAGWRAHRTTRDGGFEQVADERGVRTFIRGGFVAFDPAERRRPDFLMRPWRAAEVVDPVRTVREGRLELVGEGEVDGREAYLLVVDPDPSRHTRLYVAKDDGALLRIAHRRERGGRMRLLVQDYAVFEVEVRRPRTLDDLLGRR